jgi:uncharacterized membrane protein
VKRFIHILILTILSASIASAFPITNYYTRMQINKDASINITEYITADFTGEPHHGIFRDIRLSGKDKWGNNYRFRVDGFSVTDENGSPLKFKQSNKWGGIVDLRIGDPDSTISIPQTYVISYKLTRAIHFFDDHDELYWDVIGNDWEVPILQARCDVILPVAVKQTNIRAVAYTGYYGSTTNDTVSGMSNPQTVSIKATRQLNPGESLTIVVGWPKKIIDQPAATADIMWFLSDNICYFIPFLFAIILYTLWKKQGKDPDTGRVVTVQYAPPDNLSPAEAGTLIDECVDMRDISASIIDLAVRKYLVINVNEKHGLFSPKHEYSFYLSRSYEETLKEPDLSIFEVSLIMAMFNGLDFCHLEELQNRFYTHLPRLKDQLYDAMIAKRYFTHRPDEIRSGYQSAGIVVGILGFIILLMISFGWGISTILCGIMLVIAARLMPRKTTLGKNALVGLKGFEEYLSKAEKQEIEYQERNNIFQKFLPYAMALGVADIWARKFEGMDMQPPEWYVGSDWDRFSTRMFVYNLSSASNDWASSMAAAPRTEGGSGDFFSGGSGFSGGFSGGGGGGGGGGGW